MHKTLLHILILIGLMTPIVAESKVASEEGNVSKKAQSDTEIFNKILEFKSNDDGISYEYVDFDDDEDDVIAMQDEEDSSNTLSGLLMHT